MIDQPHLEEFLINRIYPALVVQSDGRVVTGNHMAANLLQSSKSKLSSLSLGDLLPPDQPGVLEQIDRLSDDAAVEREWSLRDSRGQTIPVRAFIWRLRGNLLGIELRDWQLPQEAHVIHQRQNAILRAVADASQLLFRSNQPDEVIPMVLADLGKAADVSRVYIFENHWASNQRLLTSQRYEWCAEGVPPQIGDPGLQNFDFRANGFDHFLETLQSNQVLCGPIGDFPPVEREVLAGQGILSIMIIPIFVQRQFWGFVGFDEIRNERVWHPYELDTLRTAANLIGAFYERLRTEAALRASEELYRMLVENQGLGVAMVDEQENFVYANLETEQLFGVEPGGLNGRNLNEFLSAEDIKIVQEQTALRRRGLRSHYEIEAILPNGQKRVLSIHATPRFDQKGRFIGAVGVFQDVSEQKRIEQHIRSLLVTEQNHRRESEALREAISTLIHDLSSKQAAKQVLAGLARILPYDRCGLYLERNGRFYLAARIGYPPGRLPAMLSPLHPFIPEERSTLQFVNRIENEDQLSQLGEETKGISWMGIPLRWNNRFIGLVWLIRLPPFTFKSNEASLAETFAGPAALSIQNSRLYTQTQRLATVDPLTGLLNRRSIFEAGERELARAQRYNEPFSLLVLDLDHFKQINDTRGHLIGDLLLRQSARRMKHALRSSDLIGRPGGDEFIALLIKTAPAEALQIAERLLKVIGERPFRLEGKSHHLSASIGTASLTDSAVTLADLLQRADQAMYAAKQNGGNQVRAG